MQNLAEKLPVGHRVAASLVCGLVVVALLGILPDRAVQGQEGSDQAAPSSAGDAAAGGGTERQPTPRPLPVVIDEPLPTATLVQRIDRGFATIVDYMARFLFYRVLARDETVVRVHHEEHYIRDPGGRGPLVRHDPAGEYEVDQLTEQEAEALAARGMLHRAADGRPLRDGRIGTRLIQCATIVLDPGTTYVWVAEEAGGGSFRKRLPRRGLLSDVPGDWLSMAEVDRLARLGRLDEDPALVASAAPRPYVWHQKTGGAPVVVIWLATGSLFFTFYMSWFNIWGFRHALSIVRGRYDDPNEPGEVTHFQALASALSATVGLGNIAGVTIAMTTGGPGACFWMMACGLFGMSSKFVECTLGLKYRRVKPDGTVLGGPMQYLHLGLKELGLGPLGLVLSLAFSVMCILASFGGGNMFQANQSGAAVLATLQRSDFRQLGTLNQQIEQAAADHQYAELARLETERQQLQDRMQRFSGIFKPAYGVVLAIMVAIVIIGGIKRIGAAAEKVVPAMCLLYLIACAVIILRHLSDLPALLASIFTEAFTGQALGGGVLGVAVVGIQRAVFSNEAGVGSAAIAHSAARTEEPIREGTVALLEPFIDTIVVCTMTALVILITGAWDRSDWIIDQGLNGAALTSKAFENEISWFPYVLAVAVVLFAYSTMISWSYYGERCWERIFGARSTAVYRFIYVTCVFVGAVAHLGAVLDFSDMMILSMAFPNILGAVLLAPKVKRDLGDYWRRYRAGTFRTHG